jgi:CRP/FNR family transcriptional regulator
MSHTHATPLRLVSTTPIVPSAGVDRLGDMLRLLAESLRVRVQRVHTGDVLCTAGTRFAELYVIHAGAFKLVNTTADGRQQLVGVQVRGDWLGFDGIATGRYGCEAVALDVGEVWVMNHDALLSACMRSADLTAGMQQEMSRAIRLGRDAMLSRCTLPAPARVAEFLCGWAQALAGSGQRTDRVRLPLTRADIGNHLGMRLESVSRALGTLARCGVIGFGERGRRVILIPDLNALQTFSQALSQAADA